MQNLIQLAIAIVPQYKFLHHSIFPVLTITGGEELSPIGTYVAYSCDTGATFIVCIPESSPYNTSVPAEVTELGARGITFEDDGSQSMLTALASEQNNGTQVHCEMFDFVSGDLSSSETLNLTVIGMCMVHVY